VKLLSVRHYTSKRDVNGNCYHALEVTDLKTNRTALGLLSGDNGRHGIFRLFGEDWQTVSDLAYCNDMVLGVREFNRLIKNAPYAGCTADEIVAWIASSVGFTYDRDYSPARRVRVIASGVSFYTTIGQIRDGVGDNTTFNRLCSEMLDEIVANKHLGMGHSDLQISLM
jgi:hypothetical protein